MISPIAPSNTAYEPSLYSLENCGPKERQRIEREFMGPAVDGPASVVVAALRSDRVHEVDHKGKCDWARFLISLLVRNPEKISDLQKSGRAQVEESLKLDPQEYDAIKSHDDPSTLSEWAEKNAHFYLENAGKIVLPSLIDNPNIGNELLKFRWFISKFPNSKFSLLTSDRPLVMTTGLRRDGCIVALPLGPRLAFFATRDKALIDNALANVGESGFVRALNESVTSQAYKHVYGSDEAQLNFVEKRLRSFGD